LGRRSETTGVRFVKQVGFKLGVKERGSYGYVESGESEEEVMGEGISKSAFLRHLIYRPRRIH